jgi:ATP-dependent DNA helicase MPH1
MERGRRADSSRRKSGSPNDENGVSKYVQKKKDRIHMPTTELDMTDMFYTQPPQEHSPPWKPRGAIWQKPTLSIGVHRPSQPMQPEKWTGLDPLKTMALPGRQSIASRPMSLQSKIAQQSVSHTEANHSLGVLAAEKGEQVYDPTHELEDLPSDAFASSSSSPQKQDDDVVVVSETRSRLVAPQANLRQTTLFGRDAVNREVPPSQMNKRYNYVVERNEPPTHHKLNPDAMKTWVYPTNIGGIRDYQFNIVAKGLFHNLLVALPTGLGKTFIAATVMLNWFRWTTEAQIVFVAPTRPLVAQQVEACFKIAGIPRSETTMLIGGVAPGLRAEEWKSKRVFFLTPQTLHNDLKSGIADPKKIVLLVVDEAHKATGAYSYVEVVSLMRRFNPSFRILALTATPGADVVSVQKVIDGLDISKIEIRTENSLDIRQYVQKRDVEKQVFTYSDEMTMCMELYSEALQPLVKKLAGLNAFWSTNPLDLTPFGCNQASRKWMEDAGRNASMGEKNMVRTLFAVLGSLSHGMDLLKFHSIGPFYAKMKAFRDENPKSKSKYKEQICGSKAFQKLMGRLEGWVKNENFVGHPKLDYLQQVILDHFLDAGEGRTAEGAPPSQTRVMVFAHFRDSAEEIVRVLQKHEPMIRPHVFVGQASSKGSEGMAQKEQLGVIEKFKAGTFNTLVATSIGEEGLDIGEVDLIVCYDSKASPLRMLQRMGRTGRKRQGRIVLLQMAGKEENDFLKAKDSYEKMQQLIAEGSSFTFHDEVSRRILPWDVNPVVDKRVVEIPLENTQPDFLPEPRKKGRAPKRPPKKFHMPDGVITGFVTANRMDEEIAPKVRGRKKVEPVYPSEELYAVPPLETVLLGEEAMKDLERRYQTVFDDDDAPIVADLDFSKDPARQRVASKPRYFRRLGRVSKGFVETLQRMHAMEGKAINDLQPEAHLSEFESDTEDGVVVSDISDVDQGPVLEDGMWASDDPASQPLPKPKAKVVPKRKSAVDKAPGKISTKAPRKPVAASKTPARQPNAKAGAKTPTYRVSDLVEEGASSSPPPTDPRMRLASQAVDLGSQDTLDDEIDDTQAYLLDSDLRDFIAGDNEDVDIPDSSLPSLDFGLGKGTQAVVKDAKRKKPRRVEKLFTSDPTDDGAIVSSDSDDDVPTRVGNGIKASKPIAYTVDSTSEAEEDDEPVLPPRKRVRRIVDDDDDEE